MLSNNNAWSQNKWGLNPWGVKPWGLDAWGIEVGEYVLTFTNTGADITPSIVVSGTPDILWTWSDGSTDTNANPADKTLTGTHTLSVNPWSSVDTLSFGEQQLSGSFKTFSWENIVYLYCYMNSLSGSLITYPWVKLRYFNAIVNSFSGGLITYPWEDIIQLKCYTNSFSGPFVTYSWPDITQLKCAVNSFSGEFVIYSWVKLSYLHCHSNNFSSLSGSFQTQIKMVQLYLQDNAITSQSEIDDVLSDLVVNAADAGRSDVCAVNLSGGTMATPSAAGLADKATLTTTYGWAMTTN